MTSARTLLLLIASFGSSIGIFHPGFICNFHQSVTADQEITVYSPGWPSEYKPGDVCRWIFDCPRRHVCRLQCSDMKLPESVECYGDKLLVSVVGDEHLDGAEEYCGRTSIDVSSYGTRLVLGLVSSKTSTGGSFRCTVTTDLGM